MPTYDYQCRSCGVIAEVVHSMLEEGPTACERCGGELRRLVSPSGIIFKGSGFYKTDSRSSSSSSSADGVGQPASKSGDAAPSSTPTDGGSTGKGSPAKPSSGESGGSGGSGGPATTGPSKGD